jgi:hypothetical protein
LRKASVGTKAGSEFRGSVNQFFGTAWLGSNAGCPPDCRVLPPRTGNVAQVQGLAIGALEHYGDPRLA